MIQFIVSVFKYSALVLAILILSHVIQIKGTTISRHVENAMDWVSGDNPTRRNVRESMVELREGNKARIETLNRAAEFTPEDQKQLNQVIQKSQKKK